MQFASVGYWADLVEDSSGGILFGILNIIIAIVLLLAGDYPPTIKRAPIKKCLYWGFIVSVFVFFLFSFFWLDPDHEGSGLPLGEPCKKVLTGMSRFIFFPMFVSMGCLFLVPLLCESTQAAYGIARTMSFHFA